MPLPLEQANAVERLEQVLELVGEAEGYHLRHGQLRMRDSERRSEVDAHDSAELCRSVQSSCDGIVEDIRTALDALIHADTQRQRQPKHEDRPDDRSLSKTRRSGVERNMAASERAPLVRTLVARCETRPHRRDERHA